MSAKEKDCVLLAPVAAAREEERTYNLTLTEHEAHLLSCALNCFINNLYGTLAHCDRWGRPYETRVRADVDTMWGIIDRLHLPEDEPKDFMVEGEDAPLPDEREAERSEQ